MDFFNLNDFTTGCFIHFHLLRSSGDCRRLINRGKKMDQQKMDFPKVESKLYVQQLTDESFVAFNPFATNSFALIDHEAKVLLELCDGTMSIKQLSSFMSINEQSITNAIDSFAKSKFLESSDNIFPHRQKLKKTFSAWINATTSCNLRCSYCYIDKGNDHLNLDNGRILIDKLFEYCLKNNYDHLNLKFAGGEPLIRQDEVFGLIDYAYQTCPEEINTNVSIITNGTLIDQAITKNLIKYKVSVGVSLDEFDSVIPQRIKIDGNPSHEDTLKGISLLLASGIRPTILTTISMLNLGEMERIAQFAIINNLKFRFSLERSSFTSTSNLVDHQQEIIDKLLSCYEFIESLGIDKDIQNYHNFNDIYFNHQRNQVCGAGDNYFAFDVNGNIGICGMGLAEPIPNKNWIIDNFDFSSLNIPNPPPRSEFIECQDCPWIFACAGGCPLFRLNQHNTLRSKSPFCEIYKTIIPRIIRLRGLYLLKQFKDATKPN